MMAQTYIIIMLDNNARALRDPQFNPTALQRGKRKHAWIAVGYHAQQRGTLLSNPLPKDSLIKGRLLSPLTNVR